MVRTFVFVGALALVPAVSSAQQPCTTDARQVVNEIYRHMLERAADSGSQDWANQLSSGSLTVRDIVREVAKSPEHNQRFGQESQDRNVSTLYRHLLGRQPDAEGNRNYTQMAQQRGLAAVVDHIMASAEYQNTFGAYGVPGSGGMRYCGQGISTSTSPDLSGSVASNSQMRFRGMDTNGDGIIQRSEWRGNARTFDTRDWNNDGVLSGDEVSVGAGGRNRNGNANANYDLDDRFDYLDVNGNGRVDRNEWDGNAAAFDRLDRNRDGRLTRAELAIQGTTSFASLDVNSNGNISLDEWRWSRDAFESMDADGNGVITQREYRSGAVGTSGR